MRFILKLGYRGLKNRRRSLNRNEQLWETGAGELSRKALGKNKRCRILFLAVMLFYSCGVERESPDAILTTFQPLNQGDFWVYEIEETVYFGEGDMENAVYYYKDVITDLYLNETSETVYVVTRLQSDDQENWSSELAYTYRLSQNRLIRKLNNEILITLVYPVQAQLEWDVNGLNSKDPEYVRVDHLGPYDLKTASYEKAARIIHADEDDFITSRDIRFEVYSEGVGLVESYYEVLNYCTRSECLGEQIIQNGRFIHLKLIANGGI